MRVIPWPSSRPWEGDEMENLRDYLHTHAQDDMVTLPLQQAAARLFDMTFPEVEEAILELQLLPASYARNRNTLTCKQHYIIDILAGILVYGISIALARAWNIRK